MGTARLLSYQHAYGWQRKGSPQAGAQLFYYQLVPKREPGVGGTPLVARWEKALEMSMALAGAKKAPGRGKERWRATPSQVAKAVHELGDVFEDMNADYHETLVRKQPPREATTRGCACELTKTKTARGGIKHGCKPVVKYVATADPPGKGPAERPPQEPRWTVGQRVTVRYENGKDYKGKVQRVTKSEIDVLFTGGQQSVATIQKNLWWLVKKASP